MYDCGVHTYMWRAQNTNAQMLQEKLTMLSRKKGGEGGGIAMEVEKCKFKAKTRPLCS